MIDDLRMIIRGAQTALRRLGATPETERLKDIWDLFVFGHHGTLNFSRIHQQPFREAVKVWAYDELPRRRGRNVAGSMQNMIRGMEQLGDTQRGHAPRRPATSRCQALEAAVIPAMCDGRQADTERRRLRVATAVKNAAKNGTPISVSAIARQAGVDRSFLYRHRDLLEIIHAAELEPAAQDPAGGSPVSRASLQADFANAQARDTAWPPASSSWRSGCRRQRVLRPGGNLGSAPRRASTNSSAG